MSVQIRLQPAELNTAYTKLIYNIASTNVNFPQYKFVCDIEDTNGNLLTTLRQPANSQDLAVFDVSVPLRPLLSFDKTLYTEGPIGYSGSGSKLASNDYPDAIGINSFKEFRCKFGEEYGTSPSSSVTMYDGNGNTGRPAVRNYNLILNRSTWEPWNESNYVSSSANTGSQSSLTGSLNYYVAELGGANYVDVNLRVDGAYPAGGFGGSGSLEWYDAPQTYKLDIISFGVSSSAYRYSMEIYDMSDNQMVYQSSQGTTLPSGYVSGSVGGPTQLDTTNFTGELGKVYGLRMNGIPTSSFNAPLFEGYYLANNFTASSDAIRSITYPLEPGNIVNLGGFANTKYWSPTINTTSGSVVGTLARAFPTLQDLENFIDPGLPAQQTGSFSTWDWNSNAGQLTWNGRLFMSNDPSLIVSASQLSGNPETERNVQKNWDSFKGISKLDYATLSYINISGSTDTVNVILRDHEVPNPPKYIAGWGSYTSTPDLPDVVSGSNRFCTIPAGYQNLINYDNAASGSITGSSDDWDLLQVEAIYNPGGSGNRYGLGIYRRDEPCDYETRSNFAFINAWGVWDFIGMNTPTNKNAIITERNEYLKPAADYNTNGAYSVYNRGFEQYFLSQDYRYQITSKPIIDRISTIRGEFSNADYYGELIHSPNVMLQVGSTFVPINITNSSFRYRTNIKSQKVFQVTIQYEMSNKPRSRT